MAVTVNSFLAKYQEFSDASLYPLETIQLKIDDAVAFISESKWGVHYDNGVMLHAAHYLSLGAQNLKIKGFGRADVVAAYSDNTGVEYRGKIKGNTLSSQFERTYYGQDYLYLERIVSYTVARQTIGR